MLVDETTAFVPIDTAPAGGSSGYGAVTDLPVPPRPVPTDGGPIIATSSGDLPGSTAGHFPTTPTDLGGMVIAPSPAIAAQPAPSPTTNPTPTGPVTTTPAPPPSTNGPVAGDGQPSGASGATVVVTGAAGVAPQDALASRLLDLFGSTFGGSTVSSAGGGGAAGVYDTALGSSDPTLAAATTPTDWTTIAGRLVLVALVAGAAYLGWRYYKHRKAAA